MLFLRKIHREALDFVNQERTRSDYDPVSDLPMGYRGEDDARNPVALALGRDFPTEEDWKEIEVNDLKNKLDALGLVVTVFYGKGAAIAWVTLFELGFYKRYNQARLYERLPLRRHQKAFRSLRGLPMDLQEKHLRMKALMRYATRES